MRRNLVLEQIRGRRCAVQVDAQDEVNVYHWKVAKSLLETEPCYRAEIASLPSVLKIDRSHSFLQAVRNQPSATIVPKRLPI